MEEFFRPLTNLFREPSGRTLIQVVDILLVAFLIYRLMALIRGTRAWRILAGIGVFVVLLYISDKLQLTTLHWILDKAALFAPVALVIVLLPELRQALEGVSGRVGIWTQQLVSAQADVMAETVEELVAAVSEMSASRIGALLVLERSAPLTDIINNGVKLDAKVSAPLLISIFYEGNPLHDGAVVVRGDVIVAAACRLPLSESSRLDPNLHMRHRAGVGVSEAFDALVVIVSEERGTIAVASDGRLRKLASHAELRDILNKELRQVKIDGNGEVERRGIFARSSKG